MQSRNEQISTLFQELHGKLHGVVARQADVPAATVEDACAFAWTQLVARPHVRLDDTRDVLNWLAKTATREAWRHGRHHSRVKSTEDITATVDATASAPENVEQTVVGRARLRALRSAANGVPGLTDRQRKMLMLRAVGYTYTEIAEITGATWRTVDRQLQRAYDRAREHDEAEPT